MNKKYVLIFLVVLALLLSACGAPQSASTPVPTRPAKPQAQASPTLGTLAEIGTQTAVALAGTPSDDAVGDGTETATPGVQPTLDPALVTPAPALATVTKQVVAPQPTVQTAKPATYTLQQGEFIFCLARRFNVDVNQTLALNGLVDSETLQPGLTVKIPAGGTFGGNRALKAHPATYTVQSGDTIYSVACLYGDVDPMNIAAVNGLAAPYRLTAGAQIKIP